MPKFNVVVTASWTYDNLEAEDSESAFEMVAADLPKCTLENMDEGSFFIEEPVEVKEI